MILNKCFWSALMLAFVCAPLVVLASFEDEFPNAKMKKIVKTVNDKPESSLDISALSEASGFAAADAQKKLKALKAMQAIKPAIGGAIDEAIKVASGNDEQLIKQTKTKKVASEEQEEMKKALLALLSKATSKKGEKVYRFNEETQTYEIVEEDDESKESREKLEAALNAISAKKLSVKKLKSLLTPTDGTKPVELEIVDCERDNESGKENDNDHHEDNIEIASLAGQVHDDEVKDQVSQQQQPRKFNPPKQRSYLSTPKQFDKHEDVRKQIPNVSRFSRPKGEQQQSVAPATIAARSFKQTAQRLPVKQATVPSFQPKQAERRFNAPQRFQEPKSKPTPAPIIAPTSTSVSRFASASRFAKPVSQIPKYTTTQQKEYPQTINIADHERQKELARKEQEISKVKLELSSRIESMKHLLDINSEFANSLNNIDEKELSPLELSFKKLIECSKDESKCASPSSSSTQPSPSSPSSSSALPQNSNQATNTRQQTIRGFERRSSRFA